MVQISAYLIFNGQCREAMTFYQQCLGGVLTLQKVADSPMAKEWPEKVQQNILHASLVKDAMTILGSDMAGVETRIQGNTISLALSCSEKEIKKIFSNLSEGAKITHPLHTFFDGTIGALTDKFGMNWILKA